MPLDIFVFLLPRANEVIQNECNSTAVVFMYLPAPSASIEDDLYDVFTKNYMNCLIELTNNLPPTVMVHGINAVTSTTL